MTTKNKIMLVVNPISGDYEKSNLIEMVRTETLKRNYALNVYETKGEDDLELLEKTYENIRPNRVLIAGGDGTIQLVAEALEKHDVSLGILPAGSANGMAVNLNITGNLQEQIEIALGDKIKEIDILKINNKTCLHISDIGINAELIKNYEKSNVRGKWGYLLQSIPTLLQCEYPFQFEIEANDTHYKREGVLLAIANASKFGTGANINPTGRIDDGKFEVLIFKNLDFIEILKTLNDNVHLDPEFVEVISTTQARITSKKPISFQIDGEFLGEVTEVSATIASKKLMLAVPEQLISNGV